MTSNLQRTISPIDGSIYVERELASGKQIEKRIGRSSDRAAIVEARSRSWSARRYASGRSIGGRTRRRNRRGAHAADGPADRLQPERNPPRISGARKLHGRRRRARVGRHRDRAEGELPTLHPPRAARRGAGGRAVELSVAHVGERGGAGAPRRQQRDPEDGAADAAGRRALRRGVQSRRLAGRRLPVPAHRSRPGSAT